MIGQRELIEMKILFTRLVKENCPGDKELLQAIEKMDKLDMATYYAMIGHEPDWRIQWALMKFFLISKNLKEV